jgi:hypothetical protein
MAAEIAAETAEDRAVEELQKLAERNGPVKGSDPSLARSGAL